MEFNIIIAITRYGIPDKKIPLPLDTTNKAVLGHTFSVLDLTCKEAEVSGSKTTIRTITIILKPDATREIANRDKNRVMITWQETEQSELSQHLVMVV